MNITVLICDDNISVHESLSSYLKDLRMNVLSAYSGEEALRMLEQYDIQFVILDLTLPGISGFDALKDIRKYSDVPVLILSARSSEFDRILGLELGADDYITKPFSPREIATRIQVILKRTSRRPAGTYITFSNLTMNPYAYTAFIDESPLDLTPKEFKILALFVSAPGIVLTREQILNRVWGYNYYGDFRSVDTQIKHIRRKLPETARFKIRSIYGVGYKLEAI